jgi:hypothetical protein
VTPKTSATLFWPSVTRAASLGESHMTAIPVEQGDPELVLQRRDLLAQRRLHDVQLRRCLAEM